LAAAGKTVPAPRDPRAFLIDFLPVVHRSLQRDGITIDHITYYSHALCSWIQRREQPGPLLIRRDPRDLSRIFVLDADHNAYLEVPYRMLSRPAITLWEHKLACKRLREQRRAVVDEASLFAAIDEMRAIEREAETLTRTARRNRTRRPVGPTPGRAPDAQAAAPTRSEPVAAMIDIGPVHPFEDIEPW
jgi:putative transposase